MYFNASINLSKIKKDALHKSEKTGHSYVNVTIHIHNEDQYENHMSIRQYTGNKEEKLFIGNGKLVVFPKDTNNASSASSKVDNTNEPQDDLPF